jgi:hypothetical protein
LTRLRKIVHIRKHSSLRIDNHENGIQNVINRSKPPYTAAPGFAAAALSKEQFLEVPVNRPTDKLQALRQKRDQLYRDARAHPDSEAGEMVRMLLLAGISGLEPETVDEEAEAAQAEERRRFRKARLARIRRPPADGNDRTPLEVRDVDVEIRERQSKLRRVAEATEEARAAAAAGRPMDPLQVYSRIAEIIGLQSPVQDACRPPEGPAAKPE